ncbi:MAG: HYR domain-containing protein [Planctomycetota bacterium]
MSSRRGRYWVKKQNTFAGALLLGVAMSLAGAPKVALANVKVDFKQAANNDSPAPLSLGDIHWINSIVQSSNAMYFEGMSNPQRVVFDEIAATPGNIHTLSLSHQATKGGIHAYDFLTSWVQAVAAADATVAPPPGLLTGDNAPILPFYSDDQCDAELGPPDTFPATCSALDSGAFCVNVDVPDDPFISKDGSTQSRIDAYESVFGNRTIRICGNTAISTASLTICGHDVANLGDTGDSNIKYMLQWTSTSTRILVQLAGHLGVSGDPNINALAWGVGVGSSQISGGPYHFNLDKLGSTFTAAPACVQSDVTSLGNQDNQIKGADILVPCPECTVDGPSPVCPGTTNPYTVSVTGTATNPVYDWTVTGGCSIVGSNTGSSVNVQASATCGSCELCANIIADNCPSPGVDCCKTISIEDTTDPVLHDVPGDTEVQCDADVPAPAAVTCTDNCDGSIAPVLTVEDTGHCPRTIKRTWTCTDSCLNEVSATQTITVFDTTEPSLAGVPDDTSVQCDADVPSPAAVTCTDNCDGSVTPGFSESDDGQTCPRVITRTWTCRDACGNSVNDSQYITVDDTTDPRATCPGPISEQCRDDVPEPDASLVSCSDNCLAGARSSFVGDVSDGLTCPETITRTYRCTDACGNTNDCTQIITVNDTTDPVLHGVPDDTGVQCDEDVASPATVTCTDNCDGSITPGFSQSDDGQTCPRVITRTWTCRDSCGNDVSDSQNITVNDTIPPGITIPDDENLQCREDVPGPDTSLVTCTDNCLAGATASFVGDESSGTCPETIQRTYRCTDACQNTATAVQIITVDDTIPPEISDLPGPSKIECPALPVFTTPTATDNCDPDPTLTFEDVTEPGDCPQEYCVTRTWMATDDCDNRSQKSETICVNDTTPPEITSCPGSHTIECPETPVFGEPTCDDDCGPCRIEQDGPDVRTPGECPQEYSVTRCWVAVDDCGNRSAPCCQTISVVDTTPPVVTCPPDCTLECGAVCVPPLCDDPSCECGGEATCNDACTGPCSVSVTCEVIPVVCDGGAVAGITPPPKLGIVEKTFLGTDAQVGTAAAACGNTASCVQRITIVDTTPPFLHSCPPDIEVCDGDPVSFTPPTCFDTCGNCRVVCARSDGLAIGDPFPLGTTTITCIAIDDCGNRSAPCTTDVTVNPNPTCSIDAPSVAGELTGTISGGTAPYTCSVSVDGAGWIVDSCDVVGATFTVLYHVAQPAALSGQFHVTVVDAKDCSDECEVTVTCVGCECQVDPFLQEVCDGATAQFCADALGGLPPFTYSWTGPGGFESTDRCINVGVAGTYIVMVTDGNGFRTPPCEGQLIVHPNPPCNITGDELICEGESTEFCAPAGLSYLWSTGATTQCITVDTAGEYCVTVTDRPDTTLECHSHCCKTLAVEQCEEATCRTPGFWGTHARANPLKRGSQNITQAVINAGGGSLFVCGECINATVPVNNAASAVEAMCVAPRSAIVLQNARQLTALALNCIVSGFGDDCGGNAYLAGLFSYCNNACLGGSTSANTQCRNEIDCFNNGGHFLITGFCQTGTCANGAACNGSTPCADLSPCTPLPGNCHDRPLVNDALGLDFDPPGPAGSEADCNSAIGNNCAVLNLIPLINCTLKGATGEACCGTDSCP